MFDKRNFALLAIIFFCAFLCNFFSIEARAQSSTTEEFFAAVRKGDIAAAKTLLDKGVDVNAKTPYGATALFFAGDRSNTEMVKMLLERGADPNARDTFYNVTPLTWAASKGNVEILRLLIEKGAKEKDMALGIGVEKGSVELVRTVLDKGEVSAMALTKGLTKAEEMKQPAIIEMLKKAGATPFPKVDEAVLKSYVGVYKSEQGSEITFTLKDGKFIGQVTGQQPFTSAAINDTTFTIIEFDGITFTFTKEADKVTGLSLKQGGGTFAYKRVEQK